MQARSMVLGRVFLGACMVVGLSSAAAFAQADPFLGGIDQGYLDSFHLTDTRVLDIGALGGGLESDPHQHKIFVSPQTAFLGVPNPDTGLVLPVDGRLTGLVHGKFRVVGLQDTNGDTVITPTDLDRLFDVSWQLIANDKVNAPQFIVNSSPGPEGTAGFSGSVNFPPGAGGTASTWRLSNCDAAGLNPGSGRNICNVQVSAAPYTGYVDYTFPISIPTLNDFTPGLVPNNEINYIITALVGRTIGATFNPVTYGSNAAFNPQVGEDEALAEDPNALFAPNLLLTQDGDGPNIQRANLLTSIEIVVTPEPATIGLLALGTLFVLPRNRRR